MRVIIFLVFWPQVCSGRHVLCAMAAPSRATFAHKKTVCLIVDDGMDVNALEIIRSLPDFKNEIASIVPNFGGKCFGITMRSTEAANRLATSGFDYADERKPLRLLGAKSIHVSIFVAVEFPDTDVVSILRNYGTLKSENLRRRDHTIQGIQIPGVNNKQSKVSQYANDTTLILADEYSITQSFNLINAFERGCGSRLNAQKTEGLWIGSATCKQTRLVNITWTTDKLKILGIYFGNSNVELANWIDRVIKQEKRLNLWKSRTLSLKGKSLIVNTIGASGLWYTATVLPMPDWVATRVNKAIYDFLWNGKTVLVKRKTCQLPFHHGSLAVINPREKSRALKLRWVPQIGDQSCTSKWVFFARYWVGLALSRKVPSWTFLRSNMCPKYIRDSPPNYFPHVLTALDRLNVDLTLLPNYRVKTFYKKLTYPSPGRLGEASPYPSTLAPHLVSYLRWS